MHENKEIRLFSKKQIIVTTIVAGPLPAAYLLSKNYSNINQNKASILTKLWGFLIALLTYFTVVFTVNFFLIQTGIFHINRLLGYIFVILLLFCIQLVLAAIFSFTSNKINKKTIRELSKNNIYSIIHVIPFVLMGITITAYLFIVGPFRFIFLIVYLLPNVYLHSHFVKIFVSKQNRFIFSFIFILQAIMFPLIMLVDNSSASIILRYILIIAYYYLPIMLYCFLFYILVDIILLINLKIKFIPKKLLISKKLKLIILLTILLITTIIMANGIFNFNHSKIHEYTIGMPRKKGNIDHLKVAMAADIHFSEITNKKFVYQFVEKINSINPDIVLLAGDIVESGKTNPKMKFIEEQLKKIKSKYGIYAVEGNHESYSRNLEFDIFKNTNINVLSDTVIKIKNSFYLIGRKDKHIRNRKSIEDLLKHTYDSLPYILLDHQPYNLEMAYNNNINLQVSGHTHHGQLFPINLITENLYELSWGYKKIKNTHFFVTCGAQGWGSQVKTASHSEIMEININFE